MNEKNAIILYAVTKEELRFLRDAFSETGIPVAGCCADGALVRLAEQHPGCVVLPAHQCSNREIAMKIQMLREAHLPHGVVIIDRAPNIDRACEILRLPVCDYFAVNTLPPQIGKIVRSAIRWGETKGRRVVRHMIIKDTWNRLDESHRRVLELLFSGKKNHEISSELQLSLRAIESRRARLFAEFEAGSFAELIRAAALVLETGE